MKILNYGSLNIDHVYVLDHFVRPGETSSSSGYSRFCGGKGLNQSIALSYAGAEVYHAGKVGNDGKILIDMLLNAGVNVKHTIIDEGAVSGHAIIQVDKNGDNCIILYGGANQNITKDEIDDVFKNFGTGDFLLLQNENNNVGYIIEKAKEKGSKIVLNPAPMNEKILTYRLDLIDIFIVNEVEGGDLTGKTEPDEILSDMRSKYPKAAILLTLGAKGVRYADKDNRFSVLADTSIKVVDTTAAGDTFIGYFLCDISLGKDVKTAIQNACRACDICVSRAGASSSIPRRAEIKI